MRNRLVLKYPRLGELYELDENIGYGLLGAEKAEYRRLMNLRYKVREEIRSILKADKAAKEEKYKLIRAEMKKRGFVPSSEEGDTDE